MRHEPVQSTAFLDVTGHLCPMTYVYTKLGLEKLKAGEILEVQVRGAAPLKNIPRSATEEGHTVLAVENMPEDIHRIFIQKSERT